MKTLPLADAMNIIKGSGISYMAQYHRFVRDNNLKELGIPYNPEIAYGSAFPGVDAYLGNPEGTAKKAVSQVRSITVNKVKPWTQVENPGRVKGSKNQPKIEQPVVAPVKAVVSTSSFASIISTLHTEYNIPLDVLYRLNETAKQTSQMKLETINETLNVLVKIAMSKTNPKVKV